MVAAFFGKIGVNNREMQIINKYKEKHESLKEEQLETMNLQPSEIQAFIDFKPGSGGIKMV